jgi:nifR3 family TIM-barrel protein
MKIGSIELLEQPVFLAPMEDVSDPPFRILCRRFGADMVYTEFISSGGLVHNAVDSVRKLDFSESERPVGIQIFGGNIDQVEKAVKIVDSAQPDVIDINFGCPVKKIISQGAGAGILRDLDKMRALTEVVVAGASRPVTVKTRLGWNDESIRILEVARRLQDSGIQALAGHARTRAQMYKGEARWSWLKKLKEDPNIKIPIIGNGDVTSPVRVKEMFSETAVDAVMIGRGAIGNPWIFRDAKFLLKDGELPPPPSWEERVSVAAQHLELKCEWLGERRGVLEMRKMYSGYFKGFRGSRQLRSILMEKDRVSTVLEALMNFRQTDSDSRIRVPEVVSGPS